MLSQERLHDATKIQSLGSRQSVKGHSALHSFHPDSTAFKLNNCTNHWK